MSDKPGPHDWIQNNDAIRQWIASRFAQNIVAFGSRPPSSPVPRWRMFLRRLGWRLQAAREWLGSKIAGRDFNDDY